MLFVLDIMQVTFVTKPIVDFKLASCQQPVSTLRVWARKRKQAMLRSTCLLSSSLGLDVQKARKTALKLHAHSVLCVHKLTTTRRTLEKSSCSQGLGLEQGVACHPPRPH